jgi:hypothetical protein
MIANTQSRTQPLVGPLAASSSLAPRVWCRMDVLLQEQLARSWAKLVGRMCRPPTGSRECEHGPAM